MFRKYLLRRIEKILRNACWENPTGRFPAEMYRPPQIISVATFTSSGVEVVAELRLLSSDNSLDKGEYACRETSELTVKVRGKKTSELSTRELREILRGVAQIR